MMPYSRPVIRAMLAVFTLLLLLCPVRAEDKDTFSRWEKEIAAFEKQDAEKPPAKNGIVFVGSSSIRLWNLKQSFPELNALNRGFGGSHLADSAHFASRLVIKYQPRIVVLYAGDNDIAAGKTPEKVAADFQEFVQVVQKDLPRTQILYLSIKPSVQRWKLWDKVRQANGLIEAQCKKSDLVRYIDVGKVLLGEDDKPRPELFMKDGLHLNEKGYELWAGVLKGLLSE